MSRGCFTGRANHLLGQFAADEKKAGERTGVVVTLFCGLRNLSDALNSKKSVFARFSADGEPAPWFVFAPFSGKFHYKTPSKIQ